jgi:hypothetical protein
MCGLKFKIILESGQAEPLTVEKVENPSFRLELDPFLNSLGRPESWSAGHHLGVRLDLSPGTLQ